MKTREEVDELKASWLADPTWDLWDTEGYEEYREELWDYQVWEKKSWDDRRLNRLKYFNRDLELGNLRLAQYLLDQDDKLNQILERLTALEQGSDLDRPATRRA